MPPKSGKYTKIQQLQEARQKKEEKQELQQSDAGFEDLWDKLQMSQKYILELQQQLDAKVIECERLHKDLETLQSKNTQIKAQLEHWRAKYDGRHHELRMERQRSKRQSSKIGKLEDQMSILKNAAVELQKQKIVDMKNAEKSVDFLKASNQALEIELSKSLKAWSTKLEKATKKLDKSKDIQRQLRSNLTSVQKRLKRSVEGRQKAIHSIQEKINKERSTHQLMEKGIITNDARDLVKTLVRAGCSRGYVYEVIVAVLKTAGIKVIGNISKTSITRILREGYFAAKIQTGHELNQAKAYTIGKDGTGHRGINYESKHIHLEVEDYSNTLGINEHKKVTRFLGIQSTRDGSSETAMKEWENTLKEIEELYNNSPLAKRERMELKYIELLTKLVGMNSDHCAKEKKDARMLEELKIWALEQSFGEKTLRRLKPHEVDEIFEKANKTMVKRAGGKKKWEALSEEIKSIKRAGMREEVLSELGREELEELPEERRRLLQLFIWAGCGCHKDLNTVRGGYMAMSQWWKDNDVDGPILLANRDNDPVLQEREENMDLGEEPTSVQTRALRNTSGGAIKLAQIAGALFNHKDDKKGHHDVFRYWWWENTDIQFTFPDTSNNRFQSYCDASAALLLHGDKFLEFMETVRLNKHNSRLNHMEQNFVKAMMCTATQTELAVLSLYAEAISYPYMRAIRKSSEINQNMLDLGPLHVEVYEHIQKILDNPSLLVANDISPQTATLHGDDWENPDVISKIQSLLPGLPHLEALLITFFEAALTTWERFTSEFAPGGAIDQATTEEKELAWLPATNDENEGALGSFRRIIRYQPQLTLLNYNALAMYFRNNTQDFMVAKFTTDEDHRYLRNLARAAGGEERKRMKELVLYRRKVQQTKEARQVKRQKQLAERTARIEALEFIWGKKELRDLKGNALRDMFRKFKDAGAPNMEGSKSTIKVDEMRNLLCDAVDLKEKGEWTLFGDMVDESEIEDDDPQIFDEDNGSEWEETDMED